ncbi:MAG: hypothetical protein ABI614_06710 [Planctomycetota bacterium]
MPVDLVEQRRAQLEARKPSPPATPPRSKIEQPLSSFVDLPEPEPPPIQLDVNESITAKSQPSESATSPTVPSAPVPLGLAKSVPAPPSKPIEKAETARKPPPLPKRNEDLATTFSEPAVPEKPIEPVEDKTAPQRGMPALPTASSPSPKSEPKPTVEDAEKAPQLETDEVELPVRGYEADRKHVATVRWLAAAILLIGLIGMVPAIIDVVEHSLSETSEGLSRWACALLLIGVLHCAYAFYLVQLPDWSSVWVVTIFTLAVAAGYAAMFGLTLLSSDQGHFVQLLDLADRLRGGKATAWCLIMLSLLSLTSYFSGRVGARWRNAFVS